MEHDELRRVRLLPEDRAAVRDGRCYFVVREGGVYRLKTLPPCHRDGREVLVGSLGRCGRVYRVAVGAVRVHWKAGVVALEALSAGETEELAVASRCLP